MKLRRHTLLASNRSKTKLKDLPMNHITLDLAVNKEEPVKHHEPLKARKFRNIRISESVKPSQDNYRSSLFKIEGHMNPLNKRFDDSFMK